MKGARRLKDRQRATLAPDAQTDTQPSQPNSDAGSRAQSPTEHGAVHRLSLLSKEVQAWARELEDETAEPASHVRAIGPLISRAGKTIAALALAVGLGWFPLQRLLQTTSAEATVNARLITLRAPIDGEITSSSGTEAGTAVQPGDRILTIVNRRADRSRLDDLRRTIARLDAEVVAQRQRLEQLKTLEAQLQLQLDAFQRGRILQLQAREGELTAEIAARVASYEDASGVLHRAQQLTETGFQSQAGLQRAERDAKVAATSVDAARQRLAAVKVELEAARHGTFVGDSYNDIPRSAQRIDELRQQIVEISSTLEERNLHKSHLEAEVVAEKERFADLANAAISVPASGRVWEVLTAPGEDVRRGQELVRILDCGSSIVSAAVSESTYNALRLGQAATFKLRGERQEHNGSLVGLNGLAIASANLAIEQKALIREPYHVTVDVPDLRRTTDCDVGRTGIVTFDTSTNSSTAPRGSATP